MVILEEDDYIIVNICTSKDIQYSGKHPIRKEMSITHFYVVFLLDKLGWLMNWESAW